MCVRPTFTTALVLGLGPSLVLGPRVAALDPMATSDYSFTVRRQPLWRETLSDPMNTEHNSTKDTTRFPAGNPDTMDDDTLQPESSKKECANTPTKPRASVGQPDTPSTASKKKTRTAIFITSAKTRVPQGTARV